MLSYLAVQFASVFGRKQLQHHLGIEQLTFCELQLTRTDVIACMKDTTCQECSVDLLRHMVNSLEVMKDMMYHN